MTAEQDDVAVRAPLTGTVIGIAVGAGDQVEPGDELLILESMKMEHAVVSEDAGKILDVTARVGETVTAGTPLVVIEPREHDEAGDLQQAEVDLDRVRADLDEAIRRHRIGSDSYRREATERRHAEGRRTARENIADLVDDGSFVEYGALVIAAQRRRRSLDDLIERTPADGLVTGTATTGGVPVAVMSYDYSVLAGTQGIQNHRKTDRLFELARRENLPVVIFAEGGGGRPGDTDGTGVAGLDVTTFRVLTASTGACPWSRSSPATASRATRRWPASAM